MLIDAHSLAILSAVHPDPVPAYKHNVHVREDGTLEATDGHILARVPPVALWESEDFPGGTGDKTPELAGKILSSDNLAEGR